VAEIARDLSGLTSLGLLTGKEELELFARDFGGLSRVEPAAAVRVTSQEELATALAVARRADIPFVVRGAGHSCNGQVLVRDGLVIRNFEERADVTLDPDTGLATLSGRSRWLDVQRALTEQGRACPVLTDYLGLSVGGTLSAGGYGARSISQGAQIDNVERLDLVLFDGRAVTCSRTANPELFRHALAGQGAAGAIERATMRTIVHRPLSRFYGYGHAGIAELAVSLGWLESWDGPTPDLFVGAHRLRPDAFTVAQYGFDVDPRRPLDPFVLTPLASVKPTWVKLHARQDLMAHARTVDLVEEHPMHARIWADYMFDYAGFVEFTEHVQLRLGDPSFCRHLTVLGVLVHRSPPDKLEFPFEASLPSLGKYKYMLGLYFFVPHDETSEISRVRAAMDELLDRALTLRGRPYKYGYATLDATRRRRLYGDAQHQLVSLLESAISKA
jgi:FAD/FMN-containing dehydrogenase